MLKNLKNNSLGPNSVICSEVADGVYFIFVIIAIRDYNG